MKPIREMKPIRKSKRAIEESEAIELIAGCEFGILSTVGADEQPYGVPLNYVFRDGAIYFHCAKEGHKIENIRHNPRVSFSVVANCEVLAADFSTRYESAIAFGEASEIEGREKYDALYRLLEKYSPQYLKEGKAEIVQSFKTTTIVKIVIDGISGKAHR